MKKSVKVIIYVTAFIIGAVFTLHINSFYRVPKIIHYVWVGERGLSDRELEAINSWKKYAPDFEIKKWDETNCPYKNNSFATQAYEKKEWRHVSDYCRFWALYEYGGIYFDVDHYLNGNIDILRLADMTLSFQNDVSLSASGIAVKPRHPLIKKILNDYSNLKFDRLIISPDVLTRQVFAHYPSLQDNGWFQNLNNEIVLFPANVFMLNFHGPENLAEHRYYNGKEDVKYGFYYKHFSKYFVKSHGLKIRYNDKENILIPSDMKKQVYYLYTSLELVNVERSNGCLVLKSKNINGLYCLENDIYVPVEKK